MGDEQNKTAIKKKPIDKEYLKSSLKVFDSEVLEKKYIKSDNESLHTHANKDVLDKLSISDTGTLLYDRNEIGESTSTAGKSAYEIAVEYGFEGTEQEWLESLNGNNGTNGSDGKSAYEIAIENGFEGTESEWLASLKGEDGNQINAYTRLEADARFATTEETDAIKEVSTMNSNSINGMPSSLSNGYDALCLSGSWSSDSTDLIRFGIDSYGNYGYYKRGADTVTPFKDAEKLPDTLVLSASGNYAHSGQGPSQSVIIIGGFPAYSLGYRTISFDGSSYVNTQNAYLWGNTQIIQSGVTQITGDGNLTFYPVTTQSANLYDLKITFTR